MGVKKRLMDTSKWHKGLPTEFPNLTEEQRQELRKVSDIISTDETQHHK